MSQGNRNSLSALDRLAAALRVPAALTLAVLALGAAAVPAQASRTLLTEEALHPDPTAKPPTPPPEGEIEGACGLAVTSGGNIYVSDYYHRVVDLFSGAGAYQSQVALPGSNPVFGTNTLDAVCGLAFDSGGRLYANEWHEGVVRLQPSEAVIDSGESTGVAVDAAGDVFVDDRTRVVEYEAPVQAGDPPAAEIDLGSLADAYGLAVSPSGARVYVPDAASGAVEVFEPATSLSVPVATIAPPGGFVSLVDAALAVDASGEKEHLLVVDNTQPGYEHPKSAVYEFEAGPAHSYVYLGRLPGAPIYGEPSGVAVDSSSGALYVSSGNDEGANVFAYSPYSAAPAAPLVPSASAGAAAVASASTAASAFSPQAAATPRRRSGSARASEVTQRGELRVSFTGSISPRALPRHGSAPVTASVGGQISTVDGSNPPQLRKIAIAINRAGRFDTTGLPVCRLSSIDPSTSAGALAACRRSLIGQGSFSADVKLPQQSPFPSKGKILAFNGTLHGRPAILAHIFGEKPVPTSIVLPFAIKSSRGAFGTILEASLPQVTGEWGYVTGVNLRLARRYSYRGHPHSYISAGCPAPAGFPGAVFPFARTSFAFAGGRTLTSTLTRNCKVR